MLSTQLANLLRKSQQLFLKLLWCCNPSKIINCERFEPRSHFKSRLSLIVRVNVVLNRTVVVDSDWRFNNLCGSHLQSLNMTTTQVVQTSVTVNNNSPIQDYVHPDDQTQPTFEMTPGFKPFTKSIIMVFWKTAIKSLNGQTWRRIKWIAFVGFELGLTIVLD